MRGLWPTVARGCVWVAPRPGVGVRGEGLAAKSGWGASLDGCRVPSLSLTRFLALTHSLSASEVHDSLHIPFLAARHSLRAAAPASAGSADSLARPPCLPRPPDPYFPFPPLRGPPLAVPCPQQPALQPPSQPAPRPAPRAPIPPGPVALSGATNPSRRALVKLPACLRGFGNALPLQMPPPAFSPPSSASPTPPSVCRACRAAREREREGGRVGESGRESEREGERQTVRVREKKSGERVLDPGQKVLATLLSTFKVPQRPPRPAGLPSGILLGPA